MHLALFSLIIARCLYVIKEDAKCIHVSQKFTSRFFLKLLLHFFVKSPMTERGNFHAKVGQILSTVDVDGEKVFGNLN